MMFPGLHPATMMSVPGMGLAGVAGAGQQGAAPQSAAAGSGFAHQAQPAGGPSPAGGPGGGGHSNGWGRPGAGTGPNGMFNGSGQRQSPSTHHAAAAPMNPFAAAAAAGFSQVN